MLLEVPHALDVKANGYAQVIGVNGSSTAGESAYRVAAIIQAQSQPQQPPSPQGEPQSTPISVQVPLIA